MIEKCELSLDPSQEDPCRYKVRAFGAEANVEKLLAKIPAACGAPFAIPHKDFNWAFYMAEVSQASLKQVARVLKSYAASCEILIANRAAFTEPALPVLNAGMVTQWTESVGLLAQKRFANFVTHAGNRFAFCAAQIAVSQSGKTMNPLVISGPGGAGKTHLANAMVLRLTELNPKFRALQLSTEKFAKDFQQAAALDCADFLLSQYQTMDALWVEDIQNLPPDAELQETFALLLGAMILSGKPVFLTCAGIAEALPFGERLHERIHQGLSVHLSDPDLPAREKILRQFLPQLDAETVHFIARRVQKLALLLELVENIAKQSANGVPVNQNLVEQILQFKQTVIPLQS